MFKNSQKTQFLIILRIFFYFTNQRPLPVKAISVHILKNFVSMGVFLRQKSQKGLKKKFRFKYTFSKV